MPQCRALDPSLVFGSFGLSKSLHALSVVCHAAASSASVQSSPSHRIRHRNFMFGVNMHIHVPSISNGSHFGTCTFVLFPILPKYRVTETSYCMYLCISSFSAYTKVKCHCNLFLKFMSIIHVLFTSHLNFMCFDILTTKTNLCVLRYLYAKMPNELGSIWTYFFLLA